MLNGEVDGVAHVVDQLRTSYCGVDQQWSEYSAIRRIQTKGVNLTLPDVEIGEVCVYMT